MTSAQQGPWPAKVIEAASHGAIAFCQVYYEAYDEPTRRAEEIPQLYLPSAKIVWNGNPVPAEVPTLSAFLASMPLSRHDLQSLDCHPVELNPGTAAPDLIVNVTGSVLNGPTVMQLGGASGSDPNGVPPQDRPRKFHEMFVLRVAEPGVQPKYAILSSNFRFIG